MATFNGSKHSDTISGTGEADRIFGFNGNDVIDGGAGDDFIDGGNGSDTLSGGAGNDEIDGGNGQDAVILAGKRADYHLTERGDGSVILRDLRAGSPDGTDRLVSIERVQFADGTFKIVDLISTGTPPVAAADALTLAENAGATNVTAILLANDSDPDGDAFKVTGVQAVSAQGANVSVAADGTVTYNAGTIFAGLENGQTATDSFTYTITDASGFSATATATVTITGVSANTAPVAGNDRLTVPEDAGAIDLTATLLANDTDADGDALVITAVQAISAKGATLTLSPDGKVGYDSGQLFYFLEDGDRISDSFTYTVTDAAGATSTATATLNITGVSQIADAYFQVMEDETSWDMLGTLIESYSFDFAGFEAEGVLGTLNFDDVTGMLTITADHASSDGLSPDSWQWTYFNVLGTEGENFLIGVQIFGLNDGVVAIEDALTIAEGATSGNLWATLMANDTDVDSSPITRRILSVDSSATQGSVTFDAATKTLTYSAAGIDLAPGETITDTFTYTVTDGGSGGSPDTATVTVTVTGGAAMSAFLAEGQADMFANDLGGFALVQPEQLMLAEMPML